MQHFIYYFIGIIDLGLYFRSESFRKKVFHEERKSRIILLLLCEAKIGPAKMNGKHFYFYPEGWLHGCAAMENL